MKRRELFICIAVGLVCLMLGSMFTSLVVARGGEGIATKAVLTSDQYAAWTQMRKLTEIAELIEKNAYKETDITAIGDYAAKGAVMAAEDVYAAYFTQEEYEELVMRQSGEYYGLGMTVRQEDEGGEIVVETVYEDSPAKKDGIEVGDVIVQVDGTPVAGMSVAQMRELLQGEQERAVTLVVRRGDKERTIDTKLAIVFTPKVKTDRIGDLLYIRLTDFNGDCVSGVDQALDSLKDTPAEGIILDLRNNLGGDLQNAIEITDMFLDAGVILTVRTREGVDSVYSAKPGKVELPLVVLVNANSASASEMFAGAIQDHKAGTVVGETTYGKGVVQTYYPLEHDGGHLRLTTAVYFTPGGRSIHGTGIEPDKKVALAEEWQGYAIDSIPREQDAQLQSAIELLQKPLPSIEEEEQD